MEKIVTQLGPNWICYILSSLLLVTWAISLPCVFSTGGHSSLKENLVKLFVLFYSSRKRLGEKGGEAAVIKDISVIFLNFSYLCYHENHY